MVQYLDPQFWITNPFVPWERIWAGLALAAHLYLVYWVYRDAQKWYYSGVWFALLAALLPLAGWLFYLFYRQSSLIDYDMIELRERLVERIPAVEYDLYLAYKRQEMLESLLTKLKAFLTGEGQPATEPAVTGYPEHIMRSRERELAKAREERLRQSYERARERARAQLALAGQVVQRQVSPRRLRLQEHLDLMEKLTEAPLPDEQLEELLYEGKLKVARMYCEDQLALAKEQNDERRINSYKHYLRRIGELLEREQEAES